MPPAGYLREQAEQAHWIWTELPRKRTGFSRSRKPGRRHRSTAVVPPPVRSRTVLPAPYPLVRCFPEQCPSFPVEQRDHSGHGPACPFLLFVARLVQQEFPRALQLGWLVGN